MGSSSLQLGISYLVCSSAWFVLIRCFVAPSMAAFGQFAPSGRPLSLPGQHSGALPLLWTHPRVAGECMQLCSHGLSS